YLLGVALDRLLHPERRVARAHGMVLVRHRRSEERHDSVAQDLVHRPLVAMTASIMSSRTGSSSLRASSGSRSPRSSIEPLRSAKRTVTCLRSPSRAVLEVRIFSARCFGV